MTVSVTCEVDACPNVILGFDTLHRLISDTLTATGNTKSIDPKEGVAADWVT